MDGLTEIGVRTPQIVTPTGQQYRSLERLYNYFNDELFDGRLVPLMMSLERRRGLAGSFCPNQYIALDGEGAKVHGLSLNPEHFIEDGFQELCQTLVHEQAHCADHQFGTPGRRKGYHSKSWGVIMETVGLCPSSDGTPEGARVGYHMQEYVIPGGKFEIAFGKLMRSELIIWGDVRKRLASKPVTPPKPPKRLTYSCPGCNVKAQAIPSMRGKLACVPCGGTELVAAE